MNRENQSGLALPVTRRKDSQDSYDRAFNPKGNSKETKIGNMKDYQHKMS